MTLYYGRARGLSSGERHAEHFVHFMKAMEPEPDLIAYFNNLVIGKEITHGVAGKTIQQIESKDHTLLLERRSFYEKKFKQGDLSS